MSTLGCCAASCSTTVFRRRCWIGIDSGIPLGFWSPVLATPLSSWWASCSELAVCFWLQPAALTSLAPLQTWLPWLQFDLAIPWCLIRAWWSSGTTDFVNRLVEGDYFWKDSLDLAWQYLLGRTKWLTFTACTLWRALVQPSLEKALWKAFCHRTVGASSE